MNLEWMRRFIAEDSGYPIWQAVHSGCGMRFVSDSRTLLAVYDPGATAKPPVFAGPGALFGDDNAEQKHRQLCQLLTVHPPENAERCDLFDFWAWLDRVEMVPCDMCRRAMAFYELRPGDDLGWCPDCGGIGKMWACPEPDDFDNHVRLCGIPFDRNRLAWWMAGELFDVCGGRTDFRMWSCVAMGAVHIVLCVGHGWRLACSSVDAKINPRQYRSYRLGCSLWWANRHDPVAVRVARDWWQDQGGQPDEIWGLRS